MDRSRWKVIDYQRALAARGAKVSGRKKDLIERLEAYERNDNFGAAPIVLDGDPLPNFPEMSKFRTLTSSDRGMIPKIGKSHITEYVLWRQALDDEPNEDISAIANGEKMISEVLALSYFLQPAAPTTSSEEPSSSLLYLTGIVRAEMKKKNTYNLKIVLDGNGEVLQSHCEGPAGRGPTGTCKHVVAVLLMLVKFVEEDTLLVQLSCTEQLQTFKRPARLHEGSPVRAEKLGKGGTDYDPRPLKYRNMEGYSDMVNNATINFCARSNLNISMRYGIEKADLAIAQLDHDYLETPFVEQ